VSSFVPIRVSSSNDDSEDENPPLLAHLPPNKSIENKSSLAPLFPRWVRSTQETTGDLTGDPRDKHQTLSWFQQTYSLLAQVLETRDPETFVEAYIYQYWDTKMNE
jgi:hypothetical protein